MELKTKETENNIDLNIKISDNWSDKKIYILKKWSFEFLLFIWLHNYNSEYYLLLDRIFSIPAIIISAGTSTAIFSTLNIDNSKIYLIVFGALLLIGTFLQSLRDYLHISSLIHKHIYCSKSYQILLNDIDEQLNLDIHERENSSRFINKIKMRKNDIILNSPSINNNTWKKLKKSINKNELNYIKNNEFFNYYFNINSNINNTNNTSNTNIINSEDSYIDIVHPNNIKKTSRKSINEINLNIEDLKKKLSIINDNNITNI